MATETIELELLARKDWWSFFFWVVFFLLFSYFLLTNFTTIKLLNPLNIENILFLCVGLVVIIFSKTQILWMLTGKISFKLEKKTLTLVKHFIGFKSTRIYDIDSIKKIEIVKNKKSNTYWGGNGFRIYDRNPVILSFTYKGKQIELGDKLANFNADFFLKEINSRKN